ncbi:MAG: FAD-dependent oxidoreductase [Trueperaceae bacterium]
MRDLKCDILIVGGGLGGVAGALAAVQMGRTVILTEETEWLGGQLTTQAVPPDEHPWIDEVGCTAGYRTLRSKIRDYYRRNYPLSESNAGDPLLNPGMGFVSPLCHEPRVALAALEEMIAPYRASQALKVMLRLAPVAVEVSGDRMTSVTFEERGDGDPMVMTAPFIIDATELGDLLELGDVERVIGSESQAQTGEPHALPGEADPLDQQAHSWCFAMSHYPGEDHTIERPAGYDFWRDHHPSYWPARQLSWTTSNPLTLEPETRPLFVGETDEERINDLWHFRRILYRKHYPRGAFGSDVSIANWPQLDYTLGPLVGVSEEERRKHLAGSMDLSLSMVYWMQTEAPRHDGGHGYPGLQLRGDITGTRHGLAMYPYIRESRRIRAEFTVLEQHVGVEARGDLEGAEVFEDSIGIGSYRIDLHPSTGQRNYVDVSNWPFQIPLGALLPVRIENLLPANKNIGTTHITNGCYRLHPVEWNIGEVAGALAAFCLDGGREPRQVRNNERLLAQFQTLLVERFGVELQWPKSVRMTERDFPFGTCDAPLRLPVRR